MQETETRNEWPLSPEKKQTLVVGQHPSGDASND